MRKRYRARPRKRRKSPKKRHITRRRAQALAREKRQARRLGISHREYVRRRAARERAHRAAIDRAYRQGGDRAVVGLLFRTGHLYSTDDSVRAIGGLAPWSRSPGH